MIAYANGYFSGLVASLFTTISDFLCKFGIVGAAQSAFSHWAFGYAFVHPGYFVSALLCAVAIKKSAQQVQQQSVELQLQVLTDHFAVVTSNLINDYHLCSEVVANSFKTKNVQEVHKAIQ